LSYPLLNQVHTNISQVLDLIAKLHAVACL
jgi:hypothetical protein